MSQRNELLASIANTIQDYRGGSIPQPIPDHVERWVQQFDANNQETWQGLDPHTHTMQQVRST